jgi:hypothetical protein
MEFEHSAPGYKSRARSPGEPPLPHAVLPMRMQPGWYAAEGRRIRQCGGEEDSLCWREGEGPRGQAGPKSFKRKEEKGVGMHQSYLHPVSDTALHGNAPPVGGTGGQGSKGGSRSQHASRSQARAHTRPGACSAAGKGIIPHRSGWLRSVLSDLSVWLQPQLLRADP